MKPRSLITSCNLKLLIWLLMPMTQNSISTAWTCFSWWKNYLWLLYFLSTRCLLLEPGRSPATKKSPAPPLLRKKHRASKLSWPCARSARCTVRSKQHVHIIVLIVYYVHMQLCLNSVAAIWINWRAKTYLYLLAVHINELFKSAIKWDKPLCYHFWHKGASDRRTAKVVFAWSQNWFFQCWKYWSWPVLDAS